MRAHILAEHLTTGDVARALDLSDEGVRHLVREEQLPCTRTFSGWRLFDRDAVRRVGQDRLERRLRGVTRLRPKKFGVRGEPRQMSLFGPQLRVVGGRACKKTSLPKGQVKRAKSGGN